MQDKYWIPKMFFSLFMFLFIMVFWGANDWEETKGRFFAYLDVIKQMGRGAEELFNVFVSYPRLLLVVMFVLFLNYCFFVGLKRMKEANIEANKKWLIKGVIISLLLYFNLFILINTADSFIHKDGYLIKFGII